MRADAPVPADAGAYYWEVTVVSAGRDGFIGGRREGGGKEDAARRCRTPSLTHAHPSPPPFPPPGVGFCGPDVKLDRLPGWDPRSYGYHGDDGHAFRGSGSGVPYGPRYGEGDVIGILLNRAEATISFTKNGVDLGVAFAGVANEPLHPTVGLRTPGECVEATLRAPFAGDAGGLLADAAARAAARAAAAGAKAAGGAAAARAVALRLALGHMRHVGATKAAAALERDAGDALQRAGADPGAAAAADAAAAARAAARTALRSGDVAAARLAAEAAAPGAVAAAPALDFSLDVRAFVELVRSRDDAAAIAHGVASLSRDRAAAAAGAAGVEALADALSLLAYSDPAASPAGALLAPAASAAAADELDAALRAAAGLPRASALDAAARHAVAARAELAAAGDAEAALVDVAALCLRDA